MDWSDPGSAVVPSLDAVVLAVLVGTTEPISGREVHRRARRGSKSGVHNVLARMEAHGLVDAVDAPPTRLYSFNAEHVAAPAAVALLDLRGQLFERIRQEVAAWDLAPVAAAVFGSAARGDGGVDSDLDLFLVRPDGVADDAPIWADQVDELAQRIRRWSGNPASIHQVGTEDVADMVARQAPVAEALRADAVTLSGLTVAALLDQVSR